MFKRLFVLLLLVAATVAASTPARAATLSVSLTCYQTIGGTGARFFDCYASASGGSPNYTFQWYHNMYGSWSFIGQDTNTTSSSRSYFQCYPPLGSGPATSGGARVVVTDSAGAQVTQQASVRCYEDVP